MDADMDEDQDVIVNVVNVAEDDADEEIGESPLPLPIEFVDSADDLASNADDAAAATSDLPDDAADQADTHSDLPSSRLAGKCKANKSTAPARRRLTLHERINVIEIYTYMSRAFPNLSKTKLAQSTVDKFKGEFPDCQCPPSRHTIVRLVDKWHSRGSVRDIPKPAAARRRRTQRTQENIARVVQMKMKNPNLSIRKLGNALKISKGTVDRILRDAGFSATRHLPSGGDRYAVTLVEDAAALDEDESIASDSLD